MIDNSLIKEYADLAEKAYNEYFVQMFKLAIEHKDLQ